ncbi:MAG: prepilin-type N-terminal cleavage/methylation domain-containing protein [Capsulimonadaceae bacterium]|nr:prepilin-type N-terminal cleavage/methylation domain-containing protein [Capsulimonadaceae bacterium]
MQTTHGAANSKASRSQGRGAFTLVEIMIVVMIIGILLAIAIPTFLTARSSSRAKTCVDNLKQIDTAKQQYVMDKKQSSTYAFSGSYSGTTSNELVPNYMQSFPVCPASGTYTVGAAGVIPTCNYVDTSYPHSLT